MSTEPISPADFEATHVIFDLAALRFRQEGTQMLALSPTGEHLGSAPIGPNGRKEACLAALDDAAARTRLWRYQKKVQVGFYNPFTAEISLGPSVAAEVFTLPEPTGFSVGGMLARVAADGSLLTQPGVTASPRPAPTLNDLSRLFIAVRDAAGQMRR